MLKKFENIYETNKSFKTVMDNLHLFLFATSGILMILTIGMLVLK